MTLNKLITATLLTFGIANVYLLISGDRILIDEHRVRVGETYYLESYGNLGSNSQDSIVCAYFTGKSIVKKTFWYSSANVFGRDSCPFLYNPRD